MVQQVKSELQQTRGFLDTTKAQRQGLQDENKRILDELNMLKSTQQSEISAAQMRASSATAEATTLSRERVLVIVLAFYSQCVHVDRSNFRRR